MAAPIRIAPTKEITEDKKPIGNRRQDILGRVQTISYFEHFNPRGYDTYWSRLKYPIEYLEHVGIDKIAELIQYGLSPNEIAKTLNINAVILRRWMDSDPEYIKEIDSALRFAGNERAYEAMRVIENSSIIPEELNKAKAVSAVKMQHAQALDKPHWGKQIQVDQKVTATMSYIIDLGAAAIQSGRPPIDVTPNRVKEVERPIEASDLLMELDVPQELEP